MAALNPRGVGVLALSLIVLSLACAAAFAMFGESRDVRGVAGSLGVVGGGIGAGLGAYAGFRLREQASVAASVLAPAVVGVWGWLLWRFVTLA